MKNWFVRGDLDGFFGLFLDNLLQLMLIASLVPLLCGLPAELVWTKILPGAAVPIALGNLFYAWQARRLMKETGRNDVTALPYGINTVSLLAFIFLVMGPVYQSTGNADLAWHAGVFACFLNGLFELVCAFFGNWIRRHTPRAALLSALAGIAITFIAMGFVFQIFASPAIALVPMLLILFAYASRIQLPMRIPGGVAAVLIGVAIAWLTRSTNQNPAPGIAPSNWFGLHLPALMPGPLVSMLTSATGWQYMSVIFPMGVFNVLGALQNLESAEAGGDRFPTRSSLLVNGLCSVVGAFLGSAFPTTIYIGHPGWKAMGARSGYSLLNALAIMLVVTFGGMGLVQRVLPIEAALGILLWIGLIMTAQAFQTVPKPHALAVGLGLVPALAAWALVLIETTLRAAGHSLYDIAPKFGANLYIHGVIALSQGFMLTSMVLSALLAHVIDSQFLKAAAWCVTASLLSMTGIIHAYELTPAGVANKFGWSAAPVFALAYAIGTFCLLGLHLYNRQNRASGLNDSPAFQRAGPD
jgi:AGZA family xanthine/uracil permease-like MFS transporter